MSLKTPNMGNAGLIGVTILSVDNEGFLPIWTKLGPVVISSAALSIIAVETLGIIGGSIMVIYREIDEWQKRRAKERERKRLRTMSEELLVSIMSGNSILRWTYWKPSNLR